MKQNIVYLFFFLFIFPPLKISSQPSFVGNLNYPPPIYKERMMDKTKYNIYYEYSHLVSQQKPSKIQHSITLLQIGSKNSKFVDIHTLKYDSLTKVYSKLKNLGTDELNQLLKINHKIGFKKTLYKNFSMDSISVQGPIYTTKYEYKEKNPDLKWKLVNEEKSILNYKVKKAVTKYAGRNWTAWYTEEIPINLGPYVFGRLPGLILELYDDQNHFHFKSIGMDNKEQKLYKKIETKIEKISKKDFYKIEKNFYDKPELFLNGGYKGVGKISKIPYNPIERIE